MNTNRSDLRMPSGSEVDSATFPTPSADRFLDDHSHDGSWKDKGHHIRSWSMERLDSMKRGMNERVSWLKPVAQQRMSTMRDVVKSRINMLQGDLHANPKKWAGIAAGAGLGLGIIGRVVRHRMRDRALPHLVIIEVC